MRFNRFTLLSVVTVAINAHAGSVSQCDGAIAYNNTELQSNYASKLSVWESVDRETFKQHKDSQSVGIEIYDIPIQWSYEQFDEERARLRSSLSVQQNIKISANGRWQAVDAGSTARYIACIDKISENKFNAGVVNVTREKVTIHVAKNENPGQTNKDIVSVISITGGKPDRGSVVLKGSVGTTLTYTREIGKPFELALALKTSRGDDLDSASFSIPRYLVIKDKPTLIQALESSHTQCEHTSSGPAEKPMFINAAYNVELIPGTQGGDAKRLLCRDGNCPGGYGHSWPTVTTRRMEAQGTCASSTNNTALTWDMWFTAQAIQHN